MWINVVGFWCGSVLVLVVFEWQHHGFWCGSVVEVCDFGLDRLWVGGGGFVILVWIGDGSVVDFGLDRRGGFALV